MGSSPSLRAVERVVGQLEPHLPGAIVRARGTSGLSAELVGPELALTLQVCGIATELSTRALSMVGLPARKLYRPLPGELDLGTGHDIVQIGGAVVDLNPLSFTQLVSLRPYEALHSPALRALYPLRGMTAVFNVSDANEVGVQFARYLHKIEPKVRRELGARGLRDNDYGLDRDINGKFFGVRDEAAYRRAVADMWDLNMYSPAPPMHRDEDSERVISEAAEWLVFKMQQGVRSAA